VIWPRQRRNGLSAAKPINSNVATHGAETSPEGLRHFELYDNTFLFDNLGEDTLNLNRWIWIRGGTGVITDNTMPDMKSRMWGDCTEIVMIVMSLRRNCLYAGHPYPVPKNEEQEFVLYLRLLHFSMFQWYILALDIWKIYTRQAFLLKTHGKEGHL